MNLAGTVSVRESKMYIFFIFFPPLTKKCNNFVNCSCFLYYHKKDCLSRFLKQIMTAVSAMVFFADFWPGKLCFLARTVDNAMKKCYNKI